MVDHYKVQQESPHAFHIATLQATLGRSASFSSHSISLGGALVRNDANAILSEGSDATLNGLYIVNGTQHIDNHTIIDHAKPHGTSHEMYKGILDGKAHAVFNGKIIVRKDAQKTDSKQTNKNLVLSDDAVIDTKPELQIFADDVRCTHGATIGQLDAESLFYLQSRGIGKSEARSLLTYAFAQDIVDRIKVQSYGIRWKRSCSRNFMSTLSKQVAAPVSTWRRSGRISRSSSRTSTASRWCTWIAPPPRRSRSRSSMPSAASTKWIAPTSTAASTSSASAPPPPTRRPAPRPGAF